MRKITIRANAINPMKQGLPKQFETVRTGSKRSVISLDALRNNCNEKMVDEEEEVEGEIEDVDSFKMTDEEFQINETDKIITDEVSSIPHAVILNSMKSTYGSERMHSFFVKIPSQYKMKKHKKMVLKEVHRDGKNVIYNLVNRCSILKTRVRKLENEEHLFNVDIFNVLKKEEVIREKIDHTIAMITLDKFDLPKERRLNIQHANAEKLKIYNKYLTRCKNIVSWKDEFDPLFYGPREFLTWVTKEYYENKDVTEYYPKFRDWYNSYRTTSKRLEFNEENYNIMVGLNKKICADIISLFYKFQDMYKDSLMSNSIYLDRNG
jgi:hypothetical protein